MRKMRKLLLNRETLRHLATPWEALRDVAGGATTPISLCNPTCPKLCNPTGPPVCTARVICGQ
jgi:hypothetical protein